ncbi:hypothetical protein FB451DRAFT_1183985 [Mycena latifolia]|nr:hypothetical protein FB451DRAFT_1183985 [Mycena latifolia]
MAPRGGKGIGMGSTSSSEGARAKKARGLGREGTSSERDRSTRTRKISGERGGMTATPRRWNEDGTPRSHEDATQAALDRVRTTRSHKKRRAGYGGYLQRAAPQYTRARSRESARGQQQSGTEKTPTVRNPRRALQSTSYGAQAKDGDSGADAAYTSPKHTRGQEKQDGRRRVKSAVVARRREEGSKEEGGGAGCERRKKSAKGFVAGRTDSEKRRRRNDVGSTSTGGAMRSARAARGETAQRSQGDTSSALTPAASSVGFPPLTLGIELWLLLWVRCGGTSAGGVGDGGASAAPMCNGLERALGLWACGGDHASGWRLTAAFRVGPSFGPSYSSIYGMQHVSGTEATSAPVPHSLVEPTGPPACIRVPQQVVIWLTRPAAVFSSSFILGGWGFSAEEIFLCEVFFTSGGFYSRGIFRLSLVRSPVVIFSKLYWPVRISRSR